MEEEITIFDLLYPKYKINKPVRLIELFGGYGSQALALKYLGVDFEHWKLCEWAIKSIQAYKDIHFENDNNDYSASFDIDFIKKFLIDKGISQNYNEPMTKEKIEKMSENYAREIFNNIIVTRNLVNISQVNGKDLEITNTDKYDYILTYSFPCQDLSLAGKGKGMKDTSTRSGLLWEVERILSELEEKPQILLMENVPQVHSQDNLEDFKKWILKLEEFGYKNYFEDLIATDYGIPQTRNRCFMVSILGDYSYTFPQKQKLELKLKDLLEEQVDEKYFLSDKQLESLENGSYNASKPSVKLEITDKGLCQTLDTMTGGNRQPLVRINGYDLYSKNKGLINTLKKEIQNGDFINTYNQNIQKQIAGTITTGISFRNNSFIKSKSRIRKLTPRECFRLMGVKEEDFDKVSKNQSDSSLYHLAGDSIVVNVLMAIFKQLL